jgi:hypothetical protein|tara:strand:+ start:12539 stop:12793 length:255 start_codon:yes stop_codon:yes gene_type:complete
MNPFVDALIANRGRITKGYLGFSNLHDHSAPMSVVARWYSDTGVKSQYAQEFEPVQMLMVDATLEVEILINKINEYQRDIPKRD